MAGMLQFILNYLSHSSLRNNKKIKYIANLNSILLMEQDARERQRKSYMTMRSVYDIGVALFIIVIGGIMLFGDKMGVPALTAFVQDRDPFLLKIFGSLCFLYGGFRLYRGIKRNY